MYQHTTPELVSMLSNCSLNKRSSQRKLYKKYYAYGMSIAIRYVNSEEEAQTILNDSFLKVFNNINQYDSSKPYKPWYRKILINTAINHLKSK